jgi:hypothetical protein
MFGYHAQAIMLSDIQVMNLLYVIHHRYLAEEGEPIDFALYPSLQTVTIPEGPLPLCSLRLSHQNYVVLILELYAGEPITMLGPENICAWSFIKEPLDIRYSTGILLSFCWFSCGNEPRPEFSAGKVLRKVAELLPKAVRNGVVQVRSPQYGSGCM